MLTAQAVDARTVVRHTAWKRRFMIVEDGYIGPEVPRVRSSGVPRFSKTAFPARRASEPDPRIRLLRPSDPGTPEPRNRHVSHSLSHTFTPPIQVSVTWSRES